MRGRILAGAVVLATTLLAGAGGAQAQGPTVTVGADGKTAPVFDYVQAIRERVWVPVAGVDQDNDGVTDRVAVDIVRPKESGPDVKVPAIIDPSPYYTSSGRGNEAQRIITNAEGTLDRFPLFYDNYFVPRGYAFIAAHAVGTAFSTGCPGHGGPGDVAGFKAVIDWLNGRVAGYNSIGGDTTVAVNWHNGKSALIGKSYDGTFANGVAATGVDGLATIVPVSGISAWYNYSRTAGIRHNTNYPASLSSSIAGVQSDVGVQPPRPVDPSTGQTVTRSALCLPTRNLMNDIDGDEHGDVNEFWRDRDHNKDAANVKASVFIVHGFQDDNVRMDHVGLWWDALKANDVKLKLWLLRAGHTDPFEQRRAEWVNTLHRWFDNQLQGIANGIDTEPRVTIEDEPDVWKDYADWPIPGTQRTDVYLRGTMPDAAGTLGGVAGGGWSDTLTFQGTANSLSENNAINAPEGSQANRRVFLSPPLTKPLRLSGTATVDVQAAFGTSQSNISAVLVDYGTGTQISRTGDGVQNTSTRTCWGPSSTANDACPQLGAECTTAGAGVDNACYLEVSKRIGTVDQWRVTRGTLDSRNRNSLWYQDASLVAPDAMNRYTIALQPTEHTFEAGHRIGIVVLGNLYGAGASGSVPSALSVAQPITIDTRLSKATLPIVGGAGAMVEAGAFTDPTTEVGGTVPPTLSLTVGAPASFGAFTPGVARTYEASTSANVTSTAGDAALTVADPSAQHTGHLVNGAFSLPRPLGGLGVVKTYDGPVSNDAATVTFTQEIGASDALRTGSYSKTLTFTLSTTQP